MIAPVVLFLASVSAVVACLALPGLSDFLLIAAPSALASLILLLRAAHRRAKGGEWPSGDEASERARRPTIRPRRTGKAERWIVVDGSNVMHWNEGVPRIETLREVVDRLAQMGFAPGVVFDANVGYRISDGYKHDGALAAMLGLPEDRVFVVPKGTPADPMVLAAAKDLGARIVTNDRYRDWAEAHPEVRQPGQLIRGGYREGALWLDLEARAARA